MNGWPLFGPQKCTFEYKLCQGPRSQRPKLGQGPRSQRPKKTENLPNSSTSWMVRSSSVRRTLCCEPCHVVQRAAKVLAIRSRCGWNWDSCEKFTTSTTHWFPTSDVVVNASTGEIAPHQFMEDVLAKGYYAFRLRRRDDCRWGKWTDGILLVLAADVLVW